MFPFLLCPVKILVLRTRLGSTPQTESTVNMSATPFTNRCPADNYETCHEGKQNTFIENSPIISYGSFLFNRTNYAHDTHNAFATGFTQELSQ